MAWKSCLRLCLAMCPKDIPEGVYLIYSINWLPQASRLGKGRREEVVESNYDKKLKFSTLDTLLYSYQNMKFNPVLIYSHYT